MTFICTIQPDQPFTVTTYMQGTDAICRVNLGHDDVTRTIFSAWVCLSVLPGQFPDGYELTFNVVEAGLHDDDITYRWDGSETLGAIGARDQRRLVLGVICTLAEIVVREISPLKIEMITRNAHLPPKALTKYDIIAATIAKLGYVSGRADPYHGRFIWMMERQH